MGKHKLPTYDVTLGYDPNTKQYHCLLKIGYGYYDNKGNHLSESFERMVDWIEEWCDTDTNPKLETHSVPKELYQSSKYPNRNYKPPKSTTMDLFNSYIEIFNDSKDPFLRKDENNAQH